MNKAEVKRKQPGRGILAHAVALSLQVGLLEQDALELLSLVRSMKNDFAPISRIPGVALSLIPDYWGRCHMDGDLIALTHVCRTWRRLFTSRPSLWTRLDFANMDKTRTYIERFGSSPLEAIIQNNENKVYLEDALLLEIPHTKRPQVPRNRWKPGLPPKPCQAPKSPRTFTQGTYNRFQLQDRSCFRQRAS